jgi:hypothetical protein
VAWRLCKRDAKRTSEDWVESCQDQVRSRTLTHGPCLLCDSPVCVASCGLFFRVCLRLLLLLMVGASCCCMLLQ